MPKEYRTIQEVAGPLMLVRGVEGVAYDELMHMPVKQAKIHFAIMVIFSEHLIFTLFWHGFRCHLLCLEEGWSPIPD